MSDSGASLVMDVGSPGHMENHDHHTVMPVINHMELANSVLNGAGAKIDCPVNTPSLHGEHRQAVVATATTIACN